MDTQNKPTVLEVQGMTCPSCIRRIDAALRAVDGVTKVAVQLRERRVVIEHADAEVQELIDAVRAAGYEAQLAGSGTVLGNARMVP